MIVPAGGTASLLVDCLGPAGSMLPDAGSVVVLAFDSTGSVLPAPPFVIQGTSVLVTLPATLHNIGSKQLDNRILLVSWRKDGAGYSSRRTYRVASILPVASTEADVRSALGVDESELHDDEIDLLAAYLTIQSEVGAATLTTALSSGSLATIQAERAIVAEAALAVLPSLRLRLTQVVVNGALREERFKGTPDFDKIALTLRAQRAAGITGVQGGESTLPTFAVLTSPTDAITG